MRVLAAAVLVATLSVSACGGDGEKPPQSQRAPAEVGVELQSAQPRYPKGAPPDIKMVLRNNGDSPCALPSSALGSVEILSVHRDGHAVVGRPGREYYYNGLAAVVADSLRDVAPGESITVPLNIETSPNGPPTLVVSQQTGSDDGRTSSWPLDQPGKYRIAARLSSVKGVRAMCAAPSTPSTVEFEVAP
jgi:hypothetical protein